MSKEAVSNTVWRIAVQDRLYNHVGTLWKGSAEDVAHLVCKVLDLDPIAVPPTNIDSDHSVVIERRENNEYEVLFRTYGPMTFVSREWK